MINILFDYQIFSLQQYGGISRYFSELVWRMNQFKDCKADIFCPLYINTYLTKINKNNVRGFCIPALPKTGQIRSLINKKLNLLYSSLKELDIVHKTYYLDNRLKSRTTVVTVYDMIHERFPQYYPANDKTSDLKRRCCEKVDKIIAISNSTKKDLVNLFGINPEKIIVIHLASSLKDTVSHSSHVFPEPYLLYVGERGGYKNFDSLVHAFSQSRVLRNHFHLICFGGSPFDVSEEKKIKKSGISRFVHQVSGDDSLLVSYYKNASAFICPSLYEGFGIPLLEAMGLSCPVICSNSGSIPEVVGDAGIYFDPHDITSIRKALENTLFNENLLAHLKMRGLQRESMFSWDRCANETVAVYRSLLS